MAALVLYRAFYIGLVMLQIAVFAIITLIAVAVVFFGGVTIIAYALPKSLAKFGAAPKASPQVISNQWSFVYSPGMSGDASAFTFPQTDGVHYIVRKAEGLALGKTITLKFNISGDGELKVADPSDIPPATVRLFIWGSGVNDRWWTKLPANLVDGDQVISAVIDPANWGGVGGNPPVVQAPFAQVVGKPYAMGFTLGGQYFAGHGVYCPAGGKRFRLLEYSVF